MIVIYIYGEVADDFRRVHHRRRLHHKTYGELSTTVTASSTIGGVSCHQLQMPVHIITCGHTTTKQTRSHLIQLHKRLPFKVLFTITMVTNSLLIITKQWKPRMEVYVCSYPGGASQTKKCYHAQTMP